ncbi:MAG TPA: alpha-ketoglutarate-dependent dioxygenase AlkB [Acidimicrobiales bacterium]|nr:alpha-ketoglutarate-dependent dioxygenase AlkB [Acidimicrobiales bacterium]
MTQGDRPAGLVYVPDFLTEAEERSVLGLLGDLEYSAVVLRGQAARRVVRHYGYDYGYESRALTPTDPLPPALEPVRARAAGLVGRAPEAFAEVLVTRYPPGAGIGWHRDAPMFGPEVVGVSLGAAARMRFQRRRGGERETCDVSLAPRSAYVLAGAARSSWQHSVPPLPAERYSITFRTVRHPERWTTDPPDEVVSDRIP